MYTCVMAGGVRQEGGLISARGGSRRIVGTEERRVGLDHQALERDQPDGLLQCSTAPLVRDPAGYACTRPRQTLPALLMIPHARTDVEPELQIRLRQVSTGTGERGEEATNLELLFRASETMHYCTDAVAVRRNDLHKAARDEGGRERGPQCSGELVPRLRESWTACALRARAGTRAFRALRPASAAPRTTAKRRSAEPVLKAWREYSFLHIGRAEVAVVVKSALSNGHHLRVTEAARVQLSPHTHQTSF